MKEKDKIKAISNLQERDKEILKTLYLLRFLTTSQILELFFTDEKGKPHIRACQIRLRTLEIRKFIESYKFIIWGKGRQENKYGLDTLGIEVACDLLSIPPRINIDKKTGKERIRYPEKKSLHVGAIFMDHLIKLNQIYIDLKKKGAEFEWYDSRHSRLEFKGYRNEDKYLTPDAKIEIFDKSYYIELDNSNQTQRTITYKLLEYNNCFKDKPSYNTPLLFICFSGKRKQNLVKYSSDIEYEGSKIELVYPVSVFLYDESINFLLKLGGYNEKI